MSNNINNRTGVTSISKIFGYGVLTGVVLSSIIGFCMFGFYETHKHVYVDIDKITTEIATSIIKSDLDGNQAKIAIKDLKRSFDRELELYAQKNKVIIFSSPKPIKGAIDKTDYFLSILKNNKFSPEKSTHNKLIIEKPTHKASTVKRDTSKAPISAHVTHKDLINITPITQAPVGDNLNLDNKVKDEQIVGQQTLDHKANNDLGEQKHKNDISILDSSNAQNSPNASSALVPHLSTNQ